MRPPPSWLLWLSLVSTPASAADRPDAANTAPIAPVSEIERHEAKRLFDAGRAAFRRGAYDVAIEHWQASLALSGEPLIHYNIGNAHERAGNLEEAIGHFEQWLEHAPAEERPDLESRIAHLRERLRSEPPQPTSLPPPAPAPPPAPITAPEPDEAPIPPPSPVATPWPTVGWLTLGIGSAATVTGIALTVAATVTRPDAAEACVDAGQVLCRAEEAGAIRRSNSFANVGDGLWIGGAALTATGLAVLLFAPAEQASRGSLRLSFGGSNIAVRGSF